MMPRSQKYRRLPARQQWRVKTPWPSPKKSTKKSKDIASLLLREAGNVYEFKRGKRIYVVHESGVYVFGKNQEANVIDKHDVDRDVAWITTFLEDITKPTCRMIGNILKG